MNIQLINWLLFLINPFISMLLAFKEYTQPYAKNIFWAFCVFYGLTFAIGNESTSTDITRYVEELQYLYSRYEFTTNDIINYFQESGEVDILRTFISYVISRYSNSQAVLTMVYAFIFGFFYSRNIWYIFDLLEGKLNFIAKLLLLTFVLITPIWYINGFRMYLAFHVFFYGLLPFIFENRKSRLIFIYLSFLIHFSYIIPISIFSVYILIGNRISINLLFAAFVVSIFISSLDMNFVNKYVENYAPQNITERSAGYRDENVIEGRKNRSKAKNKQWYVRWYNTALRWSLYILIVYFYLFGNPLIKKDPEWQKLFSLSLIFFIIANILMNLPSGGRFLIFAYFLSLIMAILYINQYKNDYRFKKLIQVLSPAFILFIIVSIRIGLYSTGITTIIGNPFIAFFIAGETMSLNDLIK